MKPTSTELVKRLDAVIIVVVSPEGHLYYQSSLKQCASFISHLHARITGTERYYDYKLIRNRIDFDYGEFTGPLAGWKLLEFKDEQSARNFMFDTNGVSSGGLREEKNTRLKEEEKKRIIEEKNNRIIDVVSMSGYQHWNPDLSTSMSFSTPVDVTSKSEVDVLVDEFEREWSRA